MVKVLFKKWLTGYSIFFLLLYSCSPQAQGVAEITLELENRMDSISAVAEDYARTHTMDTTVCILVDMNIHSGKNRLFVYDFSRNRVIDSALCAHGSCDGSFSEAAVNFSNVPESHCSSLGKYKVGKRGWSNWGTHFNYKLHGLEKTNKNAFKRIIVLHSYEYVDDEEVFPEYLVNSWGCPMVSNNTMNSLDAVIKKAKRPVFLWIYN